MGEFSKSMAVAASALRAQSARLRHVAENISNVDTPGYRRKTVPFQTVHDRAQGIDLLEVGRVQLDRRDLNKVYDPSHPLADADGYYDGSNVDLMIEIADAREAQRSYEANLKMFEQVREMSSSLLDLLRK